jgi:hypothetical protein
MTRWALFPMKASCALAVLALVALLARSDLGFAQAAPAISRGPFQGSDVELEKEIGTYRALVGRMRDDLWIYVPTSDGGLLAPPAFPGEKHGLFRDLIQSGKMTPAEADARIAQLQETTRNYLLRVGTRLDELQAERLRRSTASGGTPPHRVRGIARGEWQVQCRTLGSVHTTKGTFGLSFRGDGTVRGHFERDGVQYAVEDGTVDPMGNARGTVSPADGYATNVDSRPDPNARRYSWMAYVEGQAGRPRLTSGTMSYATNQLLTTCQNGTMVQTGQQ